MRTFINPGLIGLTLLTALTGCAGNSADGPYMTESQTHNLVRAVLQDVEDVYYRDTKTSDLVAAGLERVQETHSGVGIAREGDSFVASVGEEVVFRFKEGEDQGEADYWANRVAATLAQIGTSLAGEDDTSLSKLADTFVEGVADNLDQGATYISPSRLEKYRSRRYYEAGSLSIEVRLNDAGEWQVHNVYSAPLLESRKLRPGDTVLEIDGTPTLGLADAEIAELFYGEVGSSIELVIQRDGAAAPLVLNLEREVPGTTAVAAYPENRSLRIVFTRFNQPAVKDLQDHLTQIPNVPESGRPTGIILDLRNNPGGLLASSVEAADMFLPEGRILTAQGRHSDSHQSYSAKSTNRSRLPLIVLVNERTGSGAEIVAAALQENGRAVVIGITTYGLGSVRTVMPLPNNGSLSLPWTEIRTAGGYRLDKRGVMPAVCTGGSTVPDVVLDELRSGRGTIDYATRTRDIDPDDAAAVEAFRALCPPRSDGKDISLEIAKAILEDPTLYEAVLAGNRQETAALR